MTDVTQMQMITFLCSFHEAFWMVWWMERDHAHGLYGSDGRENKLLMGNKRVLCLTLGYGFLWYGMREMLSCLPALLLFTVSFGLLWECEEKECFLVCRRLSAGTGGNVVVRPAGCRHTEC